MKVFENNRKIIPTDRIPAFVRPAVVVGGGKPAPGATYPRRPSAIYFSSQGTLRGGAGYSLVESSLQCYTGLIGRSETLQGMNLYMNRCICQMSFQDLEC